MVARKQCIAVASKQCRHPVKPLAESRRRVRHTCRRRLLLFLPSGPRDHKTPPCRRTGFQEQPGLPETRRPFQRLGFQSFQPCDLPSSRLAFFGTPPRFDRNACQPP